MLLTYTLQITANNFPNLIWWGGRCKSCPFRFWLEDQIEITDVALGKGQ